MATPKRALSTLLVVFAACGGPSDEDTAALTTHLVGKWKYTGGLLSETCGADKFTQQLSGAGFTFAQGGAGGLEWLDQNCNFHFGMDVDTQVAQLAAGAAQCSFQGTLKDGRTIKVDVAAVAPWTYTLSADGMTLSSKVNWDVTYTVDTQVKRCEVQLTGILSKSDYADNTPWLVPDFPKCPDPAYPVDCGASGCWSQGTNCSLSVQTCGGNEYRCNVGGEGANCCNNAFVTCPAGSPFYCPADGLCHASSAGCASVCDYRGRSCW
jgi:hypothetical protein